MRQKFAREQTERVPFRVVTRYMPTVDQIVRADVLVRSIRESVCNAASMITTALIRGGYKPAETQRDHLTKTVLEISFLNSIAVMNSA